MPCRSAQLWLRWGIRILACAAPSELSRKVWVSGSTRQLPRAIQHAVRFVAVPVTCPDAPFWPQGLLFSISVLDLWYWHAVLCLLDACAEQTRVLGAKLTRS